MVCRTQMPEQPWRTALRSRSIDAAHPVDRDLLDQELVDLIVGWCFDILHFNVFRQHPGLLRVATILSLGGARPSFLSRLCRASSQLGKRRRSRSACGPPPLGGRRPLPPHFGLSSDPGTIALDRDRVLMGGSPLRLLRLTARAGSLVRGWESGATVGDAQGGADPGPATRLFGRLPSPTRSHPLSAAGCHGRDPGPGPPRGPQRVLTALKGMQCLVVDDGSREPRRTAGDRRSGGGPVPRSHANAGPAAARNAGLGQVTTPLVAFVDSDCVPGPNWLEPLLGHFDDPMVAAVAPRIVPLPVIPATALLALRSSPLLIGSGRIGRARPTAQPDPLRAERRAPDPPRGGSRRPLRPPATGRRGRRSGLAPASRPGGTCATNRRPSCSTKGRRSGFLAGSPRLLRHDRRTSGPPPPGGTRTPSGLRLVCRACGPWPAPADPSWRRGSWPYPSACWRAASTDWSRSRSPWRRRSPPAAPSGRPCRRCTASPGPGLQLWSSACAGVAPGAPPPWPCSPPHWRTGGPTGPTSTRCGTPHCTWPTTSPTGRASGGAA